MKIATIIAALSISTTAWATGGHHETSPPQQSPVSQRAEASAESEADARAASLSVSGSESSATGGTSSASSTGGSASAENNGNANVEISSTYKAVRNAPSVALGSVYPTATCQGGVGVGGSGVNGSGLLNFSFSKKECETVVLAQNFASIGMPETSCDILKTTKAWKRALAASKDLKADCDARGKYEVVPVDEQAAKPVDLSPYVRRDELAEHERRIVEKVTQK